MQQSRCVCLTAPTASGKTELSLWIADRVPVEIISMDSAMVYRGMDIGTAKPSREQRAAVPHHLIDICDPLENYSAGRFVADVARLAREIEARGRLPLIVGGTMMYLRALRGGLARLPQASPEIRSQIDAEAERLGWSAMHAQLAEVDPVSAQRISPGDPRRIQRALEIYRLSGRTLASLLRARGDPAPLQITTLALLPQDRAALREAIARRFDEMLALGLVPEVESLRARNDLHGELAALRCVGYRQIWAHLQGEYSLEEARQRAITATRQLAKRQLTWLRSDPADHALPTRSDRLRERVLSVIEELRAR